MDPIEVAIDAAHQAGAYALRRFRTPLEMHLKGPADLVTEADCAAEELIVNTLRRAFPDHGFLGEEGHQPRADAEYVWAIDPIDGTRNYARGIPLFCTSLALTRRGVPVAAVIYDPVHDETFHAQLGRGAFLGGVALSVNGQAAVEDSAKLDLSPYAAEARRAIEASLADFRRSNAGVDVEASLTGVRLADIAFDAKTLRVIAEAEGAARVAITSLSP